MANGKCVVIGGPTCSGKTTLAKYMEAHGYKRIITYTTRAPRPGEVDGIDYRFISQDTFFYLDSARFFAETYCAKSAEPGKTAWYGSAMTSYIPKEDQNTVIILESHGIRALPVLIKHNCSIVLLDICMKVALERAANRGDDLETAKARFIRERGEFGTLIHDHMFNAITPVEDQTVEQLFNFVDSMVAIP